MQVFASKAQFTILLIFPPETWLFYYYYWNLHYVCLVWFFVHLFVKPKKRQNDLRQTRRLPSRYRIRRNWGRREQHTSCVNWRDGLWPWGTVNLSLFLVWTYIFGPQSASRPSRLPQSCLRPSWQSQKTAKWKEILAFQCSEALTGCGSGDRRVTGKKSVKGQLFGSVLSPDRDVAQGFKSGIYTLCLSLPLCHSM